MAVGCSMTRHRTGRLLVVVLLAFGGAGCAAHWAYHQGQQAADKGDWDLAVARYTKALQKDPNNIRYKISLESARIQASRIHYDEAKKALAAQDLEKASQELQIASNYDPANRSAADDLALVRQRILKRDAERRDREDLEQKKARAQAAARVPLQSSLAHDGEVVGGGAIGRVVVGRDLQLLGCLVQVLGREGLLRLVVVDAARLDARALERDLEPDVVRILLQGLGEARYREVPVPLVGRLLPLVIRPVGRAARAGEGEEDHDDEEPPGPVSRHAAPHRRHHSLYGVPASETSSEALLTS